MITQLKSYINQTSLHGHKHKILLGQSLKKKKVYKSHRTYNKYFQTTKHL